MKTLSVNYEQKLEKGLNKCKVSGMTETVKME